jgi:formate hydrogenlyase subunit 6/NADH:ubiquinone oxidoreductase subunit I
MTQMAKVKINGETVSEPLGKTVLEIARARDIRIPTMCYHPALKPSGSCKLCGVEVISPSGASIVMLSCVLKIKDGMHILTGSEKVMQARARAIKRLHGMAPQAPRVLELAAKEGITLPPAPDGCIRCRLCIRVCKEIVGQQALGMESVDGRQLVVPNPGRCIGCGTCANLCPTHVIHVDDKDGVRTISIRDEIIGHHRLERCEGCGKYYATPKQIELMEKRTAPHPHVKVHHAYCPTCAKLFSDRLLVVKTRPPKQR